MEINQIARMIEWLDEERRRDKATIATLEERLAQQSETITTLQRRLNSVESDQTVLKEDSVPSLRERDLMEQVRAEMRQMLETSEARRLTAEREVERRQELSREGMMRTIRDMTEKVEKLQRSSGTLSEVRSEGSRVADAVAVLQERVEDLAKKLEEPDRDLAYLKEQRRQDARRISEIETEIPEVKRLIDSTRPKITLLEDLSIRNERRIQEMQNTEHERREQIQQFIDSQTLLVQQRDQQVDDLVKRFEEHQKQLEENAQRFETWAQTHRDMRRVLDDFERIGDRLERRINEVAEMQRLSEERFRQEWNDWREGEQRRRKQDMISNDDAWRNHDKEFELFVRQFRELQTELPPLRDSLDRLWAMERERAEMYRERYQSLLLAYDTVGKQPPITSTQTTSTVSPQSNGSPGNSTSSANGSNGT